MSDPNPYTIAALCYASFILGYVHRVWRENRELRRRRMAWMTGNSQQDALVEVLTRPL